VTIRRKFQSTMREDLVSGVERMTGRTVVAFMSDHDAGPDYAAEVFVRTDRPSSRPRRAMGTATRRRREAR
jgi:uncharacterized protein YbcI